MSWFSAAADEESVYDAERAPSVVDPGKALLGKHLFRSFCASCHGPGAQGNGSIADMLRVPPSDLTQLAVENDGQFPYDRCMAVIDGREPVKGHGTSDMPAWGDAFAEISNSNEQVDDRISQLVHFIWSIQESSPTDD
ncbi:MAG: cytochrome c [Thermoanaerobaculia bacterium]|nr:cytochrome c [Thermoanaerobaculia bacterium]